MSIRLVKTRGNLLKYNIKSKDFLFFIYFLKKTRRERQKRGPCGMWIPSGERELGKV
jgi:hypothetical protein